MGGWQAGAVVHGGARGSHRTPAGLAGPPSSIAGGGSGASSAATAPGRGGGRGGGGLAELHVEDRSGAVPPPIRAGPRPAQPRSCSAGPAGVPPAEQLWASPVGRLTSISASQPKGPPAAHAKAQSAVAAPTAPTGGPTPKGPPAGTPPPAATPPAAASRLPQHPMLAEPVPTMSSLVPEVRSEFLSGRALDVQVSPGPKPRRLTADLGLSALPSTSPRRQGAMAGHGPAQAGSTTSLARLPSQAQQLQQHQQHQTILQQQQPGSSAVADPGMSFGTWTGSPLRSYGCSSSPPGMIGCPSPNTGFSGRNRDSAGSPLRGSGNGMSAAGASGPMVPVGTSQGTSSVLGSALQGALLPTPRQPPSLSSPSLLTTSGPVPPY
mmetsp:Transcript_29720/g.64948  ORF Transcript_29720/g.64948 Transcript_29720/m.64948 type:complete len:379 (-) Transcript_29720:65-1201(-)